MSARVWAVVPAAGAGRRFGGDTPKQYLPLAGRCVLAHTLARLLGAPRVSGVVVALSPDDVRFDALVEAAGRVRRVVGGAERADSVLAALDALGGSADEDDWALVHDAVRPCLHPGDLQALIGQVLETGQGALLASPVRDTMKRVVDARVAATVSREGLWHALTPQMFRLGALRAALTAARAAGVSVTDEAQAMERAGHAVGVVPGRSDNVKITRREDLELAAWLVGRLEHAT
jgi:2-C-methyl-D-erythritol 4-phosphate cytidylyltransferase